MRTGRLRASIFARVEGWDLVFGSDVHYSIFLELGTSKMAPRPFLVPTFEEELPQIWRRAFI